METGDIKRMEPMVYSYLEPVRQDAISKFDVNAPVQAIFDALAGLEQLSDVAKKEGLLAMEAIFAHGNSGTAIDDVTDGVMLIVDGLFLEDVAEIMTNQYWNNKHQGNDAMRQYLFIRGLLMIQAGKGIYVAEEILTSSLPKPIQLEYKEYIHKKRVEWEEERNKQNLKRYEVWEPTKLKQKDAQLLVKEVEESILFLDDMLLQRVLRDTDNNDLVICMKALAKNVHDKIFANTSKKLMLLLLDDIYQLGACPEEDIIEATYKVQGIMRRLVDAGEIDLPNMKV